MAKRIITKIGDIFCVRLDNGNLRFFQYIANDLTQLNSSVIRVFKKEYPIDYSFNAEEIVNDDVDFYAHTILRFGIVENCWEKVGKHTNVGDVEHIMFRMYTKDALDHRERIWEAWHINKKRFDIGNLNSHYQKSSDLGLVFSYLAVFKRIKYGFYPGTMFSSEEH